jgi:predicted dehydrogenase
MPTDAPFLSAALIGCGDAGEIHAKCLAQIGSVRFVAYCDTRVDCAEALRLRYGGDVATDDPAVIMRDDRIAAVYICTHHDSHTALAEAAARARKAIFIEKPLALTMRDCEAIVTAVERAGVPCMVGFKMRFYPMVGRARDFIRAPRMIVAQMSDTRWPDEFWANDAIKGGGNVRSEGVHTMDLVRFLNPQPPVRIYAEGRNFHHPKHGIVDGLVATVAFADGSVASIAQGDLGHPAHVSKLSFQMMDGIRTVHLHDRLKAGTFFDGDTSYSVTDTDELGYLEENRAFAKALHAAEPMPCDHIDGLRATEMVLRAFEAIRTGMPQSLE